MITIRAEKKEDIAQITTINREAFNGEAEAKLIQLIRESDYFLPNLSLVAEVDGKVVGHILFSEISIETNSGVVPTLALAPMAVLPTYQKKGIGSLLVKEGLKRCQQQGHASVIVLGHANFYPKFGFVKASLKGIKPPFPVQDEAFMAYEVVPDALKGISGTVKYSKPFSQI
jgi:putative acetyltransferase